MHVRGLPVFVWSVDGGGDGGEPPASPEPKEGSGDPADLGDAGKRAIAAERAARTEAEKRATAAEARAWSLQEDHGRLLARSEVMEDAAAANAELLRAQTVQSAQAVAEALLKQADLAPLDVSGYGTLQERLAEGHDIPDEERALMDRALAENAVIVAQMTPFFDED